MKVTKYIDSNNSIKFTVADAPVLIANYRIHTIISCGYDPEYIIHKSVIKVECGDYQYNIPPEHQYSNDSSADEAAEIIINRIAALNADYTSWVQHNTGSAEVITASEAAFKLYEAERLYYRDHAGKIRKLD